MTHPGPIGIFDSGIGGLSIARRIRELLPNENLLYVADSIHAPYGEKSEHYIQQRSDAIPRFLMENQAKAIVVACNTATVSAIRQLRADYTLPIIGVEPGIKPAALQSKSGVIGVLATSQTLKSESFNNLSRLFSENVRVEIQPCPGLVEQIEALELDSEATQTLVARYVQPLIQKGADHIVLGCTHYAFLAPLIRRAAGAHVEVINTDMAVARETVRRLQMHNLLSDSPQAGSASFWSSAERPLAHRQLSELWGERVTVHPMR